MTGKKIVFMLIVGALGAAGVYIYTFLQSQKKLLEDYLISVIGIKLNAFSSESINVEFTIRVTNKSKVEATVNKVYADIYFNNQFIGNVENVGSFLIPAAGSSDIKLQFTFANKEVLKNIVGTFFTLIATRDIPYRLNGYVKMKSSFLGVTIPFDKTGSLRNDMLGKVPAI